MFRLVSGLDRVEIIDTIDKKAVRSVEGVHIGFGFNIPSPAVRINIPWGVIQPETGQLAGACKNWFSVERWVDISNDQLGVTWATLEAPLLEVGGLTANLPRSQPNPKAYLSKIEASPAPFGAWDWVVRSFTWTRSLGGLPECVSAKSSSRRHSSAGAASPPSRHPPPARCSRRHARAPTLRASGPSSSFSTATSTSATRNASRSSRSFRTCKGRSNL